MTPDKVQARKMVLVGAFLLAALALYREHEKPGHDTFRALWGVGVVSLVLSIIADFAPTIAGPFAMLTVLGSFASGDVSVIDRLFGASPVKSQSTQAKGGASK